MRDRCNNPKRDHYDRYGGRGIKVCERWNDFALFLEDMGPRPPGATLDRKDNDGDYEPGNCRWATWTEQQNNRSSVRNITWKGETHNVTEWATILGVNKWTLATRLQRGWSEEQALSVPKQKPIRGKPFIKLTNDS
jgi:hypothetical protein